MATFKELVIGLNGSKIVEPVTEYASLVALEKRWLEESGDSPHGRPWHTSFHASSFPGDSIACPRHAQYHLLDAVNTTPIDRWLNSVADVGKAVELTIVRANRDAGFLCRSNQPGRSSDPDAINPDGTPAPQMGFAEEETWLTGSVDMPLLPYNYNSTHIVEIKSKHEDHIEQMQEGMRSYDEKHRKQAMCSLGLAHDHGGQDFLHPTEDRILEPARDATIYYAARDSPWPGPVPTHEFYFEYDAGFMEQGRSQLREFKLAFMAGELPSRVVRKGARSHPFGWRWSEGLCKYCPVKKACKADYERNITKSLDSTAVAAARFTRPGYDAGQKRARVFAEWNTPDPLVP